MNARGIARLLGAAALGLLSTAEAPARGSHVNEDVGYRINVPDDFELKPRADTPDLDDGVLLLQNEYMLDRFDCTKPLPSREGYTYNRRIITYYFPERSAADIARRREEEQKELSEKGSGTITFEGGKIYQGFADYAKDNITGFFFDAEKSVKVAGFEATLYEMKFEKLQMLEQRWLACAYKIPGGEFAVMCTSTDQHFKDLRAEYNKVFNSFRMLDQAGLKARELNRTTLSTKELEDDEKDLSPEALLEKRKKQKEEAFAKCLEKLPSGWRSFETEHFLVVYACDPAYAKEVGKHSEKMLGWLEETFPGIGDGLVQAMILRVYEKQEDIPQSSGWMITFGGNRGRVREISYGKSTNLSGWISEFTWLNRSLMHNWFEQKNDELWRRMPAWLRYGLDELVDSAEIQRGKLAFKQDEFEKDAINDAKLQQKSWKGDPSAAPIKPIRLLMTQTGDELFAGQGGRFSVVQAASVLRYLIEGPGKKQSRTANLVTAYLGNLFEAVDEVERKIEEEEKARRDRKSDSSGKSEQERLAAEDEEYQKRRELAYNNVARDLLQKAYDRTFGEWEDKDWSAFDSTWNKFNDGRIK